MAAFSSAMRRCSISLEYSSPIVGIDMFSSFIHAGEYRTSYIVDDVAVRYLTAFALKVAISPLAVGNRLLASIVPIAVDAVSHGFSDCALIGLQCGHQITSRALFIPARIKAVSNSSSVLAEPRSVCATSLST